MKRSDTETHNIELLLTLDYLLNETDESHPATASAICEYARKYGLVYNGGVKGDDVKRQRIGKCLHYLKYITDKYVDEVPFIIQQTDSGKFYVEQKSIFTEEQVIKILSAVKNDKYTQDEDTGLLIERLLDSFSNKYNRDFYKEELNKLNKGVKKYNNSTDRKIRLINKAYKEGKMIKVRYRIYKRMNDYHTYDWWYRVYRIMEFNNKPYALLIPISTGDIHFFQNYLFDAVENLMLPNLPDKELLLDDVERDLDKMFIEKNKWIAKRYSSPDEMIEKNMMPVSGIAMKVSFYFHEGVYKYVNKSFEHYFSKKMDFVKCKSFDTIDEKEVKNMNDKFYIVPHPLKENEVPEYGVVNTFVDLVAFVGWLTSDVHNDGTTSISDMVTVVGPSYINKRLYQLYINRAKRIAKRLSSEEIERINSWREKRPHMRTEVKLDE